MAYFRILVLEFVLLLVFKRVCSESLSVNVAVDVDTVLSVGGYTRVPEVFGITSYTHNSFAMFETEKGQAFLKDRNIDFVAVRASFADILPNNTAKLSVDELQKYLSGQGPSRMFQKSLLYPLIKSDAIRKGGATPFYFLLTEHCSLAQKWNCDAEDTPLGIPGSNDSFVWWGDAAEGVLKQMLLADPQTEYVQILNEPDQAEARDGYNITHYIAFYNGVVGLLRSKEEYKSLKFGGPVTWDPPNGPFAVQRPRTNFYSWFSYMKPFLDAVIPRGLLDYVSFHAYNNNTNPDVLESALNVLNGYTWSKYKRTFSVAITESNIKIFDPVLEKKNHTYHYNYRTFLLALATLSLIKQPNQVITRLLFDFETPGKSCSCKLYNGTDSQELQMYALLGHLRKGTRLLVTTQFPPKGGREGLGKGGTGIIAEAVQNGGNYTIALVNTLNTPVTAKLQFNLPVSSPLPSWAAMMDAQSLRVIPAPDFPSGSVELPSKSIFLATFDSQAMSHVPKNKKDYVTVYPQDSSSIMVPILESTFKISVSFVFPAAVVSQPYVVTLQFGALGPPTNATWTVEVDCFRNGTTFSLDIKAPGLMHKTPLPTTWGFSPLKEYKCSVQLSMSQLPTEVQDIAAKPTADDMKHSDAIYGVDSLPHHDALFQFSSFLLETTV